MLDIKTTMGSDYVFEPRDLEQNVWTLTNDEIKALYQKYCNEIAYHENVDFGYRKAIPIIRELEQKKRILKNYAETTRKIKLL